MSKTWQLKETPEGNLEIKSGEETIYSSKNAEQPISRENLELVISCINACRNVKSPENLPEVLKILKKISEGCPAKPGKWLYDHEMASLAKEALNKLNI